MCNGRSSCTHGILQKMLCPLHSNSVNMINFLLRICSYTIPAVGLVSMVSGNFLTHLTYKQL